MIIGTEIILDGLKLKLQLTVDEMPATPKETILFENDARQFVYGETPEGYVTYGSISKVASVGPVEHLFSTESLKSHVWK